MWYDILVLGILVYFTVRGAARGMVWQLAGIAGIVVCFVFADAISAFAGPYVQLEPPLNNWVVLFGAYVVFTLISYVVAGQISEFLARVKLREFDRHLGAVFGFVKGVVLSLILTFLVVTMSEDARAALKQSRSGIAAAKIVKTVHPYLPILPEQLVQALEKYIHLLDDEDLDSHYANDHDHEHPGPHSTSNVSLGNEVQLGDDAVLPANGAASDAFAQLGKLVGEQTRQVLQSAIQSESDQASQQTLVDRLVKDLQNAPPEQRQAIEQYFQLIAQRGSQTLLNELKTKLGVTSKPAASPSDPAPVLPTQPVTTTKQDELAAVRKQIVSAYTADPNKRKEFENQIDAFLGTLPLQVHLGVLQDWNADIWSLPDPDRQTTGQSTLEQRILRQLQLAGIPITNLDPAMQQRLNAASR